MIGIGPDLCLRCATARASGRPHECVDRDGGGPYAHLRDWQCRCECTSSPVQAASSMPPPERDQPNVSGSSMPNRSQSSGTS
jgi:hypothetical protein